MLLRPFYVFEDGQIQNVRVFQHDVPMSVGLIGDDSGSMRPKRKAVTSDALAFVGSSNPQDETFIVNFNEPVSLGLTPDQLFYRRRRETREGRERPTGARNDGALRRNRLWAGSPRKAEPVKKGSQDNASRHNLPQISAELECSDVPVYTIGFFDEFDAAQNPGILRKSRAPRAATLFCPVSSAK